MRHEAAVLNKTTQYDTFESLSGWPFFLVWFFGFRAKRPRKHRPFGKETQRD